MSQAPENSTPESRASEFHVAKAGHTVPTAAHHAAMARRLLARIRDVMAGSGAAQSRLDKIVTLIAAEMGADVCSCYVMRAGEVLELFATLGLNPSAVHKTRLRVGEGLVGDIAAHARPVALANAQNHPNFAYRPETGEDPFHSLMGVPIMRASRVRGVLVIQHKDRRDYAEEEVEMLQTVAMIVAELVAAGELVNTQEISLAADSVLLPSRVVGISLNPGLAMGLAVLHRSQPTIRQLVADDPVVELQRFTGAVESLNTAIDDLLAMTEAAGGESRDIIETYKMFAADRGWLNRIREAINSGLTAEAAVQRVQTETQARMSQLGDPYIRERLLDFEDLTNRLLQHLSGKGTAAESATLPDDIVLVARSMGPAELLDYDRRRLRALIMEEGSPASHVAIVARALDIPVVAQCTDLLARVESLDPIIVDGDGGQVLVRPGEDAYESYSQSIELRVTRQRAFAELRDLPAVTANGVAVSLLLNCGLSIDLPHLEATGADGIGLYRTEIPFMVRSAYPNVAAQTELYARVLEIAAGRPVNFRTLDIGADKTLPYFTPQAQENPALGWRAIRIGLDRPAMLRQQLRALLRAACGQELRVMFPMVAEVAELVAARRILDLELARLDSGRAPAAVKVGVMIEVPSLLWQLPELLARVDFISVGSNDLMQYLFACDRGDAKLAGRFDPLSPPMLRVLRQLVQAADSAQVPLSVCGEMAGRPLEAMVLLGMGVRNLSMAPAAVGSIKTMLRSVDVTILAAYLDEALKGHVHSMRDMLRSFAYDHGVLL